jgi:hypothetical protein
MHKRNGDRSFDELWARSLLNLAEQGRSIFFHRRWTLINADARRAIARLMYYGRDPFWSNMNDNDLN